LGITISTVAMLYYLIGFISDF